MAGRCKRINKRNLLIKCYSVMDLVERKGIYAVYNESSSAIQNKNKKKRGSRVKKMIFLRKKKAFHG